MARASRIATQSSSLALNRMVSDGLAKPMSMASTALLATLVGVLMTPDGQPEALGALLSSIQLTIYFSPISFSADWLALFSDL